MLPDTVAFPSRLHNPRRCGGDMLVAETDAYVRGNTTGGPDPELTRIPQTFGLTRTELDRHYRPCGDPGDDDLASDYLLRTG